MPLAGPTHATRSPLSLLHRDHLPHAPFISVSDAPLPCRASTPIYSASALRKLSPCLWRGPPFYSHEIVRRSTSWTSGTSMIIHAPAGLTAAPPTAQRRLLYTSVLGYTGSFAFSFDGSFAPSTVLLARTLARARTRLPGSAAPLGSSALFRNSPWCGGQSASITISGLNFGFNAQTASVVVSSVSCQTTAWTSSSTVACMLLAAPAVSSLVQDGFGADVPVFVTVSSLAGSASFPLLTFDGAFPARQERDERRWLQLHIVLVVLGPGAQMCMSHVVCCGAAPLLRAAPEPASALR